MTALRTVLCPVDFSEATPRQVDFAAGLCRTFGATLVLHHNRHSLGTGASVGWMWHASHQGETQARLEARLNECCARVQTGVKIEPLITEGPVSRAVLAVSEAVGADLVILTAHAVHDDDHVSISEQMLERGRCAVLVLHEPAVDARAPRFTAQSSTPQVVLAPTDLTPESRAALDTAFALARMLPVELHLAHLVTATTSEHAAEEAYKALRALVPDDLADRSRIHVRAGDPAEGISALADQLSAACIVMGEHARTPLRRWFSRDTSRAVLHTAHCPVWYVPGTHAA